MAAHRPWRASLRLAHRGLCGGEPSPPAGQPCRQAPAVPAGHRGDVLADGDGPGPALRRPPPLERHGAQPRPPRRRHPDRRGHCRVVRRSHRLPAAGARLARALRRRDLAHPAHHHPADPLHHLRPRRDLQGDAHRTRHRAGDDPLAGAGSDGHPEGGDHQSRDPRRYPRRSSSFVSCCHRSGRA